MELTVEAEEVAAATARLATAAPALRALPLVRRCRAVSAAAAALADPAHPLGRDARRALPEATGLSPEMVEWALATSLEPLTAEALTRLAEAALAAGGPRRPVPPRLVAVVLAGNVFTAALRPVAFPLALGAPVACKAPSRDDLFPRLLARSLAEADPEVGAAIEVLTFPGGTEHLEGPLFTASDTVVAFGGDATIADLRSRLAPTTRLIEHGHGVGAAFVGAAALADEETAVRVSEALALDTAAYDQRGCMSPGAVWVERGAAVDGRRFAELLGRALDALGERLPRGPLPADVAAVQMQWRGVAAVRGWLREGAANAVAFVAEDGLPPGPGWRNLAVVSCAGVEAFARRMDRLGVHLKTIGVAGGAELPERLSALLEPPACPRICPVGTMQMPPLEAAADGSLPAAGLLRWLESSSQGSTNVY